MSNDAPDRKVCTVCGNVMIQEKCKNICLNCGNREDCTDP